ncbi:rhomboid family intramembrane serine protease [Allosediminivita pacifica]|uniref:Membrane associated rhomboid family serine protease n=1 Tax=Allosediminivita pacifica TaxID=1267769 RepID=A0A2T6AZD8_9RHOB|nr:rhomboid family intramembrane serine protease [Allosediminivita pacifica]PTX49182.1 membrane associated rhomboid family serine protease [Allosediminivita pacifica]GGB06080.1 rhomboid family intramembrane serine protease [Allosediminivita pacifica]
MFPIRDHNPSGRTPFVTYGLIAANVAIFLSYWQLFEQPRAINEFFFDWALIPALVSEGRGWTGFVTSMFLHGGIAHLGGNMLFLFIFGDNIEDEMGHGGFLLFYLASGLAAAVAQYVSAPLSPAPMVGASGAIAGVMGGYLLLYPRARVDILIILVIIFRVIPIPAWIILAAWFAMQIFGGLGTPSDEGGVAYWAHAGGFLAGLAMTVPVWLRRGGPAYWSLTHGHPPHPEARYPMSRTRIPKVPRK